ncbi:MAG: pseudouridine synthase [Bacilli bacterium]
MRLDRFLAIHGFGSRKSAKKMVHNGHVMVNGEKTLLNDMQISGTDKITVDGKDVENVPFVCLVLNKPQNYVCSMLDDHYPSCMKLIPDEYRKRVRMVGRLDADTTGLLIFTDNGVLNSRLANPKFKVTKTYAVEVNHILKPEMVEEFQKGNLDIGQGDIADSAALVIQDEYHAEVTVHEGKYHEIKRLFGKFGYDVIKLKRLSLGPVKLGDVEEGKFRKVSEDEYESLLEATHLIKEDQL